MQHKDLTGKLAGFAEAEPISPRELLALECDVLVPAALENTVDVANARSVKAKVISEAANGPLTPDTVSQARRRRSYANIP